MNIFLNSKSIIFTLLLFVVFLVFSFQATHSLVLNGKPQAIDIELNHTISFQIQSGNNARLNFLNVNSYYVPETIEPHQIVHAMRTNSPVSPVEVIDRGIMMYTYSFLEEHIQSDMELVTTFEFTSIPQHPKITSKSHFPILRDLSNGASEFLQFTEQVNINLQIEEQARELARGEDDVFIIATKIANWVQQEIEYDLSTVFENPNQNAVEIFESRRGVCKELSIIYASMLRSLGIPVRLISGYAYTTSEEIIDFIGSSWGGHAWAEVYIDGTWVPFDLTYQQYGFVDSTHIILQKGLDLEDLGIQVEMSAFNHQIVQNSLVSEFDFLVQNIEDLAESFHSVDVTLFPQYESVQTSSFAIITARIENLESYYQAMPLYLVTPSEMEPFTDKRLVITLPPNEIKEFNFIFKMPEDLMGFSFPMVLYSGSKFLAESLITTSPQGELIDEDFVVNFLEEDLTSQSQIHINGEEEQNQVLNQNNIINNGGLEMSTTTLLGQTQAILEGFDSNNECSISNNFEDNFSIICNVESLYAMLQNTNYRISNITLCALQGSLSCNTLRNEDLENSNFELHTRYSLNDVFVIRVNEEISFSFRFTQEVPVLEFHYDIFDDTFFIQGDFSDSSQYIQVIIGSHTINLDTSNPAQELVLDSGQYIGIVYHKYMGELVDFEIIEFKIYNPNFFQRFLQSFSTLFSQ